MKLIINSDETKDASKVKTETRRLEKTTDKSACNKPKTLGGVFLSSSPLTVWVTGQCSTNSKFNETDENTPHGLTPTFP